MKVSHTPAKRTDEEYVAFDPFDGERDVDLRLKRVKMVTTRKPHMCLSNDKTTMHEIPAGERARYESALVDGEYFGSYYLCVKCMDDWIDRYY